MKVVSMHFRRRAHENLGNDYLQATLKRVGTNFVGARASAILELDDFEGTREAASQIRDRVLRDLDVYLTQFEQAATARGATVHWAETAQDVNRIVCEIASRHGVRKAIKSKSMVSEECALNDAMEAAGLQVVETDLGEYILQLAKDTPSHLVAPVLHKSKDEVSDLFAAHHNLPRKTDINELCLEARQMLRPHFLSADMGISGGNFLIAETGSVAIVTNEGNGRMTTTLPRVHVAITGIEKIVPNLEDLTTLLRLLPRSSTGQSISNYVSVLTGTRGQDETDGAEHMHFILVDAGRSQLLATNVAEALKCIRCGACMNHCPVYQNIGGHSYGWVYPGPIGSILTPAYAGLEKAVDLPNASTLCNQCGVVCPVKIPLPDLLRKLRETQWQRRLRSWQERMAMNAWAVIALRPRVYAVLTRVAALALKLLGGRKRLITRLPFGHGWTAGRDMPAPSGTTFRQRYAKRKRVNK